MGVVMAVVVLLVELVATSVVAFWAMAFLGFAGEAHRLHTLTLVGWLLGILYLSVDVTPVLATLWLIWRRFFSKSGWPDLTSCSIPSAYWLPAILLGGGVLTCWGLLALQNTVGFSPR